MEKIREKVIKKINKRCNQLFNECNMIFKNGQYIGKDEINQDFNIAVIDIQFSSDKEWEEIIKSLKSELNRRKEI